MRTNVLATLIACCILLGSTIRTVSAFTSSSVSHCRRSYSSILTATEASIPDFSALTEVFSRTLPGKTSIEIQEMTRMVSNIMESQQSAATSALNGAQQMLHSAKFEAPDMSFTRDILSVVNDRINDRISALEGFQYRETGLDFIPSIPKENVFGDLQQLLSVDAWTLADLFGILKFEEYGTWYSSAAAGTFFTAFLVIKSRTPSSLPDIQTAKSKEKTQTQPKNLASPSIRTNAVSNLDTKSLDSLVVDLSQAVMSLSTEIAEMKESGAVIQRNLATVEVEYNELRGKVEKIRNVELTLKTQIVVADRNQRLLNTRLDFSVKRADILDEQIYVLKEDIGLMKRSSGGFFERTRQLIPAVQGLWFANLS